MITRQQVVLALMVLAVLYGAYSLFTQSTNKAAGEPDQEVQLQAANTVVMTVATSLTALPEAKANKYILTQAESEWSLDPFFKYAPISEKSKPTEDEKAIEKMMESEINLVYTGYIAAGDKLLAVVNGVEYEPGEKITESGLIIVSITQSHVVIGKEGSSVRKVINME